MRNLWRAAFLVAGIVGLGGSLAGAQVLPSPPRQVRSPAEASAASFPGSPMEARQRSQRVREEAIDRRKRIVDSTARLLRLAEELNSEIGNAVGDQIPADLVRKVEEIEKLARDVKQRTKG